MSGERNLFDGVPAALAAEQFDALVSQPHCRIERILSRGQASPPDFWYDQTEHEWVLLLQGEALLRFQDRAEPVRLRAGDCIEIPAHCRHRVEWTTPDDVTIWLAVFYG